MSESIHGHQVIAMIANHSETYTQNELLQKIAEKFGESARFHTCMDDNLTSKDLIDFLTAKGKIVVSQQGLDLAMNHTC